VHRFARPPALDRREGALLEESRRRYQEKFCGVRNGVPGRCPCEFVHCLGEACELFGIGAERHVLIRPECETSALDDPPRVCCIMPTSDRPAFVTQAVRYFLAQDYPAKELLVVDDGAEPIDGLLPDDPAVRYLALDRHASVGEKRNAAVEATDAPIIAHWDDDDWYGPHRLSFQLEPLRSGDADVTGIDADFVFDIATGQFWSIARWLHAAIMRLDVHGGTIVYRRDVWERAGGFPAIDCAEDAALLERAAAGGARIVKLPNRAIFVYVRHRHNTWRFTCGEDWGPDGWTASDAPEFMPSEDLAFYRRLAATEALA
jgi:glycosyltransferase involved in cell wall biosynthesis